MPGILHQDLILHEIPRRTVDNGILKFFEYKLGVIRDESESENLLYDWPSKIYIDKLVCRKRRRLMAPVRVLLARQRDQQGIQMMNRAVEGCRLF